MCLSCVHSATLFCHPCIWGCEWLPIQPSGGRGAGRLVTRGGCLHRVPHLMQSVLLHTHTARPSVGSCGWLIFGGYTHLIQTETTLLYHDVNS